MDPSHMYFDLWMVICRLLQSQVYFLREEEDGPIKIGYADNVIRRMYRLQQGNPSVLRVIATMPGANEQEKVLHRRFRHLRVRGEWFRADEGLLEYIRRHTEVWSPREQELSKTATKIAMSLKTAAKYKGVNAADLVREVLDKAAEKVARDRRTLFD
jgi:hypothetical protein